MNDAHERAFAVTMASIKKELVRGADSLAHRAALVIHDGLMESLNKRISKEAYVSYNYTEKSELRVYAAFPLTYDPGDGYGPTVPLSKVIIAHNSVAEAEDALKALRRTVRALETYIEQHALLARLEDEQ